jgi:hypothetical protein
MLRTNPSGLVGLIVIESTADLASAPLGADDDATLGQLVGRLARGARPAGATRMASAPAGMSLPALVTADCGRLGAELEQAARQVRRRIAVAERIAR